jgi:hypothetical protein
MSTEDLNLSGVKSLDQALARTRNGVAAVELAKKMGVWTESAHTPSRARPAFPQSLSELTPGQLSDLYAKWTAEFGRVVELCGVISGQESLLKIQVKSAQAAARGRARRAVPEGAKVPAQQALTDASEEDPAVLDLIEQTGLLVVISAQAGAAKEATAQYLATISREIAFRDAQMKARVY